MPLAHTHTAKWWKKLLRGSGNTFQLRASTSRALLSWRLLGMA